jgi:hypothetical protein
VKNYKSILLNLLFFLIGIAFLYLAFAAQDLAAIWQKMREVDYRWGIIVLMVSVLNQYFRAYRWRLLINPLQTNIPIWHIFSATMVGYFVNLAVPRLGEVTRCWALQKDKVPFWALVGTVVTERVIDVLSMLVVFGLVFAFQFNFLWNFSQENIFQPLVQLLQVRFWLLGLLSILSISGISLLWAFQQKLSRTTWGQTAGQYVYKIYQGVLTIRQIPEQGWFWAYTGLIWATYWLMTYLWFFGLPDTAHLGGEVALALLAIGALAQILPIQGSGLGAYHFLIIQSAVLFGLSQTTGATLAFLVHSTQLIFKLLIGGICMLWVLWRG